MQQSLLGRRNESNRGRVLRIDLEFLKMQGSRILVGCDDGHLEVGRRRIFEIEPRFRLLFLLQLFLVLFIPPSRPENLDLVAIA